MGKISQIEITFPVPVELPEGFEKTLSALVGMACDKYESENPDRVMWAAGHGSKPIWREPEEPTYDDSVYQIQVEEKEDENGRNPHNPNGEELREQARQRRAENRKQKSH